MRNWLQYALISERISELESEQCVAFCILLESESLSDQKPTIGQLTPLLTFIVSAFASRHASIKMSLNSIAFLIGAGFSCEVKCLPPLFEKLSFHNIRNALKICNILPEDFLVSDFPLNSAKPNVEGMVL